MASLKEYFQKVFPPKKVESVSKEQFATGQDWLNQLLSGGLGGFSSKFITDIYGDEILYPHDEMNIAKKAYRYNSYVNSSARTRANFMLGGSIRVTSEDKGTENWLNEMIKKTALYKLPMNTGTDLTVVGNSYYERIYQGGKVVYYDYIPEAERIYVVVDEKGLLKKYVQEVPDSYTNVKSIQITYYGNKQKTVKGIELTKDKIVHFKLGVSEIPQYGRGYVASNVNDVKMLLEVERAMAVIARYKSIPKKAIMLKPTAEDTYAVQRAQAYANQISAMSDQENIVFPEEIGIGDLSYSSADMNFEPILNYLKKKITVALAPSFIMHGEETNYAVSRDQKEAFILAVQAERETIADQLKRELQFLAKNYNKPIKDFEIEFGEFDLGQTEDKMRYAKELFTSNMVTLNEARELIGFEPDKELGENYYSEINTQGSLLGLGTDGNQETQ